MIVNEIMFWVIIGGLVAAEVLGGLICWLSLKEVDQCHK
jgi:hypothetical protein